MSTNSEMLLKEGRDVIFSRETTVYLIDGSGSMNETFGTESIAKMAALRMALNKMFEARTSVATVDKVAVLVFNGHNVDVVLPLTVMREPSQWAFVSELEGGASTPMYQAFEKSVEILAEEDNTLARIVLCTDGEPNAGYSKDQILDLTRMIGEAGIVIDCVGVGDGGYNNDYDEDFLRQVAKNGAGEFFPVTDQTSLVNFFMTSVIERRALLGDGMKLLGNSTSDNEEYAE